MKRLINLISRLLCLAAVVALAGCNHKELCYHHPHTARVRVVYDWVNAPDADPDGMCVWFYPEDGSTPVRVDFSGTDGGYVELATGRYTAITFNNDTEAVQFGGSGSFDTHYAFTRDGGLLESIAGAAGKTAPQAADERVVITPDRLWGASSAQVDVVDNGGECVITFYPEDLVCHYTCEIRHVTNLGRADRICGSLSSMSGALYLGSQQLHTECVTLPFAAEADADGSTIRGEFFTFGHHEANPQRHKVLIYVWMADGRKLCYGRDVDRFDVTEQIHAAPDRRRVHIIIDGLDLPEPIDDSGGFNVDVDDWTQVNEDLYF